MILVLLGTQNKSFDRLLNAISKEIKKGNIKDKVIAQTGFTLYSNSDIETFDYKPKDEIQKLIEEADIIITHGGVGTIIECLDMKKKIIVSPRLKKYKEHTNDHQLQITKEFHKKGYVLPLYKMKDLCKVIEQAKEFIPKNYESNADNFRNKVKEYIDNI